MSEFVKKPNLPQKKVKTIICGSKNKILTNYTKSFGIKIISSDLNNSVDKRIAEHTDISVFHLGQNKILLDYTQEELKPKLEAIGMEVILCGEKTESVRIYPRDCSLNCTMLGDALFAKKISIERKIPEFCDKTDIKLINVNQGYTKCSMLVIDENSFITDDESIYSKGLSNGFDCIKISKGSVKLGGFDYGFIGGCGGPIDKKHLLFFGDITRHSDFDLIKSFLTYKNCTFDYLNDYPLCDIGGFVPVIEFD